MEKLLPLVSQTDPESEILAVCLNCQYKDRTNSYYESIDNEVRLKGCPKCQSKAISQVESDKVKGAK